jgi:hypothetical protein
VRRLSVDGGGVVIYLLSHLGDPLGRGQVEHHLIGDFGGQARHRRTERPDSDAGAR